MKVLLSWLREFVDVPGSPEELARTMSVRGFAVEGIEPLGDGDAVLDFEVTANRPDCMSVVGMAREVATALRAAAAAAGAASGGTPSLTTRARSRRPAADPPAIDIVIENADLCPRYVGAVADVTVGPSPDWMQARLQAAGIRPISNIVDVTNYVLLELGQPMHAFDLAKLAARRFACGPRGPARRSARSTARCATLSPDMLVIADAERAGRRRRRHGRRRLGGRPTRRRTIVLESAYFNPLSVRRTSKKLGLKTEASMRFERGADSGLPADRHEARDARCSRRSAPAARAATLVDRYPTTIEPRRPAAAPREDRGLLGAAIPDADVRRILRGPRLRAARRRRRLGRDRTDPARGRRARGRSDRGGRAALRLRSPAGDVPRAHRRAARRSIRESRAPASCAAS